MKKKLLEGTDYRVESSHMRCVKSMGNAVGIKSFKVFDPWTNVHVILSVEFDGVVACSFESGS